MRRETAPRATPVLRRAGTRAPRSSIVRRRDGRMSRAGSSRSPPQLRVPMQHERDRCRAARLAGVDDEFLAIAGDIIGYAHRREIRGEQRALDTDRELRPASLDRDGPQLIVQAEIEKFPAVPTPCGEDAA